MSSPDNDIPQDESVRERLLVSASRLFAQKGYAGTTVREIVDAAGVTKPVLYYYFGNKEGIYLALMKEALVRVRKLAAQATEADGATAADSVTFDGFGRVADGGLARISIDNAVAGNDYRPLAIVISEGGGIRMCDPRVSTDSDPRAC